MKLANAIYRPGEPQARKPRKKRFMGDFSARKAWEREMMRLAGIFIPLKTVNELNDHSHFRNRQKRAERQHFIVAAEMWTTKSRVLDLPVRVTLTRYSPGTLDAHDGLPASFKFVADAVAKFYKIDDADPRISFAFEQERAKHFGIRIQFERSNANGS